MPPKQITHDDLLRLKSEIVAEDTERRHEDRHKAQQYYCFVDDIKTENALLKQSHSTMSNDIKDTKEVCEKILTKIDWFHATFVTKEEHKIAHTANEKKIEKIENILGKINWIIISSVVLGLLALIIKMN